MQRSKQSNAYLLVFLSLTVSIVLASAISLFDIKLVESGNSRLVATSNYNYAMTSPQLLSKTWSTASVNGDQVFIVTTSGDKLVRSKSELGEADWNLLESIRDEIANNNNGFSRMSWSSGGGFTSGGSGGGSSSIMSSVGFGSGSSFSSSSSGGNIVTSSGGGPGGFNSMQMNDMSVTVKDSDNLSVSRNDFPFNWSRVFFNGDLVTIVFKDSQVRMSPMSAVEPDQLIELNKLKTEVKAFQAAQAQQAANTVQTSMDMVSNVFGSIMGRLPKPPSLESSGVSSMFGSNFPFGSNNSPFSSSSSWPFSSGGAFAFAGRRR